MNKKISAFALALFFVLLTFIPSYAQTEDPRLVDGADILTEAQENSLEAMLVSLSEKHEFDFVIHTVDDIADYTMQEYAQEMYDISGYGYGEDFAGLMLVLSMKERDWFMLPNGELGEIAFSYPCIEYISEKFLPYFGEDNYNEGFEKYLETCEDFVAQAKAGEPYGKGNLPKAPFKFVRNLIVSVVIGVIIAFIVTGVMKGKLKSVRSQAGADSYIKNDSLKITNSRDYFLYRQVICTAKPKNNSSASSSTYQGTGKGGGGKF
ncbi:MAG: TPM domain-containing protein [Clostridia bacterium]|nr:TPM domain-containing protein [Clostridia bacterium]